LYEGPTVNALAAAEANGRAADRQNELEALFNLQNTTGNPESTSIPATFLRVAVTRLRTTINRLTPCGEIPPSGRAPGATGGANESRPRSQTY
jgi:hypothetical protein